MKFILTLSAIAGLVSAQNLAGEPACATSCLSSAIVAAGCAATDQACACGTAQAAIQTAVTPCLLANCNQSDLIVAASVGLGLCSAFSASGASTTAASTSEPDGTVTALTTSVASPGGPMQSASSSASVTTLPGGPLQTSGVVSVHTATSSSASSSGSASGTSASQSSSAASSKSASASGSATGGSATSSAPAQASTNAAPQMGVKVVGGLAGVFMGVVAAL